MSAVGETVRQCRECGHSYRRDAPLTRLPSWEEHICSAPRCRAIALDRARAEHSRLLNDTRRAQLPDNLPVAFLPVNRTTTSRLPERLKRRFGDYLRTRQVAAEQSAPIATGEPSAPAGATVPASPVTDPVPQPAEGETALLAESCATCRGHCCKAGGTRAWITADTIRRVRRSLPDLSPAALHERYVAQLPTRNVTGSCVYHTARGCALEPLLRSDTCHRYLCDGVLDLLALARRTPEGSLRVAAVQDSRVVRTRKLRRPTTQP